MPAGDAHAERERAQPMVVNSEELDTDMLLCLLSEVEEQLAESRACVHQASSKLEEGKEFEAAAAERAKEAQLSEATRRKLQRRVQIINAEVKGEIAKSIAQLRHAAHHYKHTRGEIERALRQRDRRMASNSNAEGRADALAKTAEDAKDMIKDLQKAKEGAEVRAQALQKQVEELERAKRAAETHGKTLSGAIAEHETALSMHVEEAAARSALVQELQCKVEELEATLAQERDENKGMRKSCENLRLQLVNSKDVVARITADNLMFLNKIKHGEARLEQAVREREVLRVDLNTNDNRWFEHLRDELYKVTQTHLEAIDDYQAEEREGRLQAELESAHLKLTQAVGEVQAKANALDNSNNQLETTRSELRELSAQYQTLASSHGAAQATNDSHQSRLDKAELELAERQSTIADLQARLQEAGKAVAEASRKAEEKQQEASSLRDDLTRHKAKNAIMLGEKHDVEQKHLCAQAEQELQARKLAALEGELASVRQEKDLLARQLSTWATAITTGTPGPSTPAR